MQSRNAYHPQAVREVCTMHLSFRTTQDTPHAKSSRPNPPSDKRLLMTMRTFGSRALALLASCALVASMTPIAAFAGGSEGDAQQQSTGVQQSTTAASDAGEAADANASVTARANVASSSDDEGSWGDDDDRGRRVPLPPLPPPRQLQTQSIPSKSSRRVARITSGTRSRPMHTRRGQATIRRARRSRTA